jgi:two-component system sensor histidine kinase AlgZ
MENKLSFTDVDAEDTGLLPNFCDVRVIFMLVLLVELLAIVLTAAPSNVSFWDQLAFISMLMQWIGLLNAAILCGTRKWLNALPTRILVTTSFFLMMLVSVCFCLLVIAIKNWMLLDEETSPLGENFLLRIAVISAAVYAVVLRYFYIQQQWKLHLQAHSKAEIQALRARIRPHFLFNSMNTIASLISFKPEKAEKAVEDLADIFRASLREQNINTLADELSLTRSYVDIEKLRLDQRLKIDWSIDSSLEDTEVPALCLQPLVENAIYHGIEPLPEGGQIFISASQEGNQLVIKVCNPIGTGAISQHKSNHMAQENIKQRLHLVYGASADFNTNETKEDYTVILKIPLDTKKN